MNYKEHLKLFNRFEGKDGAYLYKFVAASEVDWVIRSSIKLTDEQFELVCSYVYTYISTHEMSANELCIILLDLLEEETITLDDFKKQSSKITQLVNNYKEN